MYDLLIALVSFELHHLLENITFYILHKSEKHQPKQ